MNSKQYASRLALSATGFTVFLMATKPDALPVYLLFIPYIFAGLMAYYVWMTISGLYFRVSLESSRFIRLRAVGVIFACFVVVSTGLSSLGEFTLRDFTVALLLSVGSYFYVARNVLDKK